MACCCFRLGGARRSRGRGPTPQPWKGDDVATVTGEPAAKRLAPGGCPILSCKGRINGTETLVIIPLAASSTGFVLLGAIYFVLLVTLGIMSIRKGHWVMFIIGIFIPLFWIIGALMPPKRG